MATEYRHNHYVPEWYQKRFLSPGQTRYAYLDLRPERVTKDGHSYTRKDLLRWGPARCFALDDLYTTKWGHFESREIEKFFFGHFDTVGPEAVEHFANFQLSDVSNDAFQNLVPYLSVQKLRTPKGLAWLRKILRTSDPNKTLIALQDLQNIFCNVWGEAVWQIADASSSPTKFIISDHPVVVYNRECFPGSQWCVGANDPDIRFSASHTYFPLSLNKILILTNLSWVRDPFQNPMKMRPNPRFFRPAALFNMLDIQHERILTEEEVQEINYVTKKRAFRYVAAAEEDWLYPERFLRSTNWRKLGDGYLFMPDPRHIHGGGTMYVGYSGGGSDSWSEYGHKPWQKGYEDKARSDREWEAMTKFKAEWTAAIGPNYRGVLYEMGRPGREIRRSMGNEWYEKECELDRTYLKKPGEFSRRQKLKR